MIRLMVPKSIDQPLPRQTITQTNGNNTIIINNNISNNHIHNAAIDINHSNNVIKPIGNYHHVYNHHHYHQPHQQNHHHLNYNRNVTDTNNIINASNNNNYNNYVNINNRNVQVVPSKSNGKVTICGDNFINREFFKSMLYSHRIRQRAKRKVLYDRLRIKSMIKFFKYQMKIKRKFFDARCKAEQAKPIELQAEDPFVIRKNIWSTIANKELSVAASKRQVRQEERFNKFRTLAEQIHNASNEKKSTLTTTINFGGASSTTTATSLTSSSSGINCFNVCPHSASLHPSPIIN